MIVPLVARKAFAAFVITLCLGLQLYAIVWLSGRRWWPFVDYRMFSKSYSVGATFQELELRGRACEESSRPGPLRRWRCILRAGGTSGGSETLPTTVLDPHGLARN